MATDDWTLDEQRAAAKAVAMLRAQQQSAVTRDKDGKIPYQIIALPRRTIIVNWIYRLVFIGVGLAIIALILLNIRPAVRETFFGAAPQTEPTAATHPTQAARLEYGGANDVGRYAPIAVQPVSVYPDTVPPYQAGAWTPGGPFTLDVAGRRYRALGQQGGATFAELDDGARVWLGTAAVAGPEPAQPAVVAPQPTAPPIGPVETWGEGGTSGGTTWGEPTAMPLQNAIIPAMPQLDAPTPTWGEGGSTGGSTW